MKLAIVIGIERYADDRLDAPLFAASDAAALAKTLELHGFAASDRVLLLSDQATKSSCESRLRRALKRLTADDDLLLYYGGQVLVQDGSAALTCFDTDVDDPFETSVSLSWLAQQLRAAACQQMWLFLDCRDSSLSSEPLDDTVLAELTADKRVTCFVSRDAEETSHTSATLRRGIWSQHVIEAFDGRATSALAKGKLLTASSLQRYLAQAVPRTLTASFRTQKEQTPRLLGSANVSTPLADMNELLEQRACEGEPSVEQVQGVTLLAERTKQLKDFDAYKKSHRLPDRPGVSADAFVARLATEDITADINQVFAALKTAFKFKRADLQSSNVGDGAATIVTPYFNYSITIGLDPEDISQVKVSRTVDDVKQPSQLFTAAFSKVFAGVFDTVRLDSPTPIDLPGLVDRIEELNDERIELDYDPQVTYCRLRVQGVSGAVTVQSRSLSIVHTRPQSPQVLLRSLLSLQAILGEEHDMRLLPPAQEE